LIGDAASGTQLSSGAIKGILAAKGDINFGGTGGTGSAKIFENAAGANAAAIDAIFTDGGLALDIPDDLDLILADLAALKVTGGVLSGPVA
jgi:hypothetical protein